MTTTFQTALNDMIYLVSCAINEEVPEADRIAQMDLDLVYKAADRHMLTSIAAFALESAGMSHREFLQAKAKAIRKLVLLDTEREQILQKLEEAEIWYMPLKGILMKDLYPSYGMRQMADNDILFDSNRAEDVKVIMETLGYTTKYFMTGHHDNYEKLPVYYFEMHRELFGIAHPQQMQEYYRNVKDRLIKDNENAFGYHFSPEDFYIYMVAHEYKHYSGGGTGLRSLLDTYVYCRERNDVLDWDYITSELQKLEMVDFEKQNRQLARLLFHNESLAEEDQEMLEYILSSGTYGTLDHQVTNSVRKLGGNTSGKMKYLRNRVFLPMNSVKSAYPFFYRHKILLPVLAVYRLGKALIHRRKRLRAEIKALMKQKD